MGQIKLITDRLGDELIASIQRASGIYILTSFVMESGVKFLEPYLIKAAERKAEIQILTGDYLYVTQPGALRKLLEMKADIEVRMWRSNGTSFHGKAYIFDYSQDEGCLIVGSSNMSKSAYLDGLEWNLAMDAEKEPMTFQQALQVFQKSFYHEQTCPLNYSTLQWYEYQYNHYHRQFPEMNRVFSDTEERSLMLPQAISVQESSITYDNSMTETKQITPRPAQQSALEALRTVYQEGYRRAMVVMATGLGKTYLAGFFAKSFHKVLFIAHREEILYQAKQAFHHIMPERTGGLYFGSVKEPDADFVFASIFTLSIKKHRERFSSRHFDLIIVDEFHHAAANSYQKVLDYFQPVFLLGITATPDRLDGKDVYALCDGNVAYQLHFIEAIQRGWLCPFHYYGIYDDINYNQITWLGNRYHEEELLFFQLSEERARNIYEAWIKYKQTRTIAFCSSIKQADFLADYYKKKGRAVISLHSQTVAMTRREAIEQLTNGSIEAIFTVDLFNEGVDIPCVDTLLFCRPTESLTVFIQQIGRGLRLFEDKSHCTIIDLIGNYRNADLKLRLFDKNGNQEEKPGKFNVIPQIPQNCKLDFEIRVIDLLQQLATKKQPRKEKLKKDYMDLKYELGRRPTYLELHLKGNSPSKLYKQEFRSYVGFLYWAKELTSEEEFVFRKVEHWLREVERTVMSKSYKMVVLLAMLQRGPSDWYKQITPAAIAPFFHQYLTEKEYRKQIDFSDKETKRLWEYEEKKVSKLIAKMPMSKWSNSSKGLVSFHNNQFFIRLQINQTEQNIVYEWTKQICEYRLHAYFERKAEVVCDN